ncbi:iron-containing alcohol dehydrogenase [Candidatus Poribacteria bacterium]|nr:iron-containing alcohol dehydrogenase [Candidatus Poribacteria bacterium]
MKNFEFYCPTRVIFGKNTESQVGTETKKYGKKILLHYGGGSIKRTGLYDRVIKSLRQEGIEVIELGGVMPNPRLGLVREGIDTCRGKNIDFILVVGGGSTVDSGKAIAAGTPYKGDVWDFFSNGAPEIETAIPLGVVLTIPAAGSEVSPDMVVTNEEGWLKRPAGGDPIRSRFSIMNPELTFTLSAHQTVIGISDILAHIYERYFSQVSNTELVDRLAEATMKTVINNTRLILKDLRDYDARAEIMWAGSIAHNNLLATGKEGDWGSHNIEHELSAIYDIPHGEGLAIVFPAWMKYVYRENKAKFVQFAERVWNIDGDSKDEESIILEGIARMEEYYKEIGLPVRLSDIDIGEDRFAEMAEKCVGDSTTGVFKKLDKDDVFEIYKLAL